VDSSSTYTTDQNIVKSLFYTTTSNVLPDYGPLRSRTCRS